ncbi:uncharacterized protein LOC117121388 isoform X2 [Anneissia japonica]|uniref:uncharacterized protein LOC117121388 isoform X2 n=1 Tax=Anneissia japonica TaxID=1529436 RepID=UPI001425AE85|nr:uncharacterized protein LOC117121388 isoform X2 [Anneissia japonica]
MSLSVGFKPLSPLQEEEEEVEEGLISLAELLHLHNGCLFESELWAVCRESVISLKSIKHNDLYTTLCVCPETIAFNTQGKICYLKKDSDDSEYLPPEYNSCGPTFEGHLYSLARCLLEAAEFNLPADLQVEISNGLFGLITLMSLDDPSRRPSYEEIIAACLNNLGEESSQTICRNLSSIGRSIVNLKPIETNAQERGIGEGEEQSRPVADGRSGTDDIRLNAEIFKNLSQHQIQQPGGIKKYEEISMEFTDTNQEGADSNNLIIDLELTKDSSTPNKMSSGWDKEGSQNGSTFDNLSQRAQEILKKIYSGTDVLRDSITNVSVEETSGTETPTEATEVSQEDTSVHRDILDQSQWKLPNKITGSLLNGTKKPSKDGRRNSDTSFRGVYHSSGSSLIPNKIGKAKHYEGEKPGWKDHSVTEQINLQVDNTKQKLEENNNLLESASKCLPITPRYKRTYLSQGSIPEEEEKPTDLKPGSRKVSSCSEGKDSDDFLLNDPWSSSESDLVSPIDFQRTVRSHSIATLNTFNYRQSAFEMLQRKNSETLNTSLKNVDKTAINHDSLTSEDNSAFMQTHFNTKRKSIGNSKEKYLMHPAKSSECTRRASLSVLPSAYSSKATHFTPIVISSDKSATKVSSKEDISPVNSVKLKAKIAMEAIKKGPQVPKKIPPPITMVTDLEKDAASEDVSNSPVSVSLEVSNNVKKQPMSISTDTTSKTSLDSRRWSLPDAQQNILRKQLESKLICAVKKSAELVSSFKEVDNDHSSLTEKEVNDSNSRNHEDVIAVIPEASIPIIQASVDKNTTHNQHQNSKVGCQSSPVQENVSSISMQESLVSSSLQLTSSVSVTSASSPITLVRSTSSSATVMSPTTQSLISTTQQMPFKKSDFLPVPVVSLAPISSPDVATQNPTGKLNSPLPNISGPVQLCQDPQTGLFHIIPVTVPIFGAMSTLQSSLSSDIVRQSLSPTYSNYSSSPASVFATSNSISTSVISSTGLPTTFVAKTDLTGVHSSAFRPIERPSNLANNVPPTVVAAENSAIPCKAVNTDKEIEKKNITKKDGIKKEYRKKIEKKHGVASKLPRIQATNGTDSESSECTTYQDSGRLARNNVRMPRYMKRTVKSNRVDVSHDFEKTRSKSQDRKQGRELEQSKLRDRSKSLDRKTHEKLHKPDAQPLAQPCRKSNQDVRGRKRNTKTASSVDPRSHVVFALKDDVDDTKPLDTLNTAVSPTSVSTVSRDSGVHLRYSHSSGEDVTANPLKDALVANKVLRKVVKLVRIAFAFDGYLENGVEDLQMAEYIVSLAHLRWMTFASAITEKFCDLFWEEDLIENLYEAVNGSVPEKSQRPLAMSPSRPRRKTEPITLSPSNTPDNLDSDDNVSIIDDLLPADKPASKRGTKENTALMRSHVVADTKLFRELIEKRKESKTVPGKDGRKQVKEKTKKLKDQHGVNPKDLTEKLNKLEKITKDGVNKKDIERKNKNPKVSDIDNYIKNPVAAPRIKKRNKMDTLNSDNLQSSIVAISEKGQKSGSSSKSNKAVKNEQRPSTKSNSLDCSHHEAELSNSRSSIASGSSSHGSLSKSLDDDRSSDMYAVIGKSMSSAASVRSVQSWDTSGSNEPGSGEEQIIQTHRKPKMLAPSLPNPTTLARHSSESSSGSGSATRHKLKSMLNQKLTHASSSLSLNSTSSGVSINPQSIGASKEDSILSFPSSLSGSIGDDQNILLNAGVMYKEIDPQVEDYTNKLVVNCETQQGIEAKIRVIDQELMMERKMRSKSQRFYQKMIEAQQLKAFPRLEPALNDLLASLAQNVPVLSQIIKPSDHKSMVLKVGKQIDEMTAKVDFLESAKRNLEMLYSEQWGLDHALLYSFATSMGQEPMYLHPSPEECPLLSFHYVKSSCMLQAGEPLGLFSYLFARQALLEGYIHHFFSTYHYYATTEEVYKFIVDKFCAARSMSSAQAESRTKILCRTIDIILVWIENYYTVDFRPNLQLVNQLSEFIREKIMPVDAQGECLLKLLEKRQQEKEEDKLLETLSEYRERGSHDKPKKRYSIREVLSVPTRALRKEKMRGGIISCLSPPKKEPQPRAESIYMPVQPIDKGFMMSEYTAQTLACQLTLMQQELFRKVHPVHYLNSRYHGIGVSMETDVSLASSALSRVDDREEQDYPSLFVNTLGDEGLVHILLQHAREVSHWVAAEVVTSSSPKYQIAILCKFITIARECYDTRNLATCVQIIDALDSLIVRQVPAWRSLPSKIASSFEKLKAAKIVLKGDGESLTQGNSHHDKPTLPCSLFLLMHLQQSEVGGFTLANGMYKWTKMKCIAKLVDQIRIFQEHAFTFEPDNELQHLLRQRILQMSDHDIHSLAAQYSANFHQLASEQNSRRFKIALKKVKTTLQ